MEQSSSGALKVKWNNSKVFKFMLIQIFRLRKYLSIYSKYIYLAVDINYNL